MDPVLDMSVVEELMSFADDGDPIFTVRKVPERSHRLLGERLVGDRRVHQR